MPSSVLVDMDRSTHGQLEADQRALQIALELSMLGLTSEDDSNPNLFDDIRNKKSMNMTECVPVPSSEHVAEIVGRQGGFPQLFCVFIEVGCLCCGNRVFLTCFVFHFRL